MTVAALDLDHLAAGALEAPGIGGDAALPRDLPARVRFLLLAEVGGVVVLQTHVTLELRKEWDALETAGCQWPEV